MKRHELLKLIDDDLLNKLFGFCYARTNDSHEAEDLCSDIALALVKAAGSDGDIENAYAFIWQVARNVYADFTAKRKRKSEIMFEGDPEDVLPYVAKEDDDGDSELLGSVLKRIAFLTKEYREAMVMFYFDGLSTSQIAKKQGTSEANVRQRLFKAREKIRNEVNEMSNNNIYSTGANNIKSVIWGTGNPSWGDPRDGFIRILSQNIVWICRRKPVSASEIAEEINVPTVFVEDELEILSKGANGKYGLLRRLDNGKYVINFILLDKDEMESVSAVYTKHLPEICDAVAGYISSHKSEYLSFPYLNKKVDLNLILWQQIYTLSDLFENSVERVLKTECFSDIEEPGRPFSVYGYVYNGKNYTGGLDGVSAQNICGFKNLHLANIYNSHIDRHFGCGHNVAEDMQIQLALRAIDGLKISALSETEKESAAEAVRNGYLYRDGDTLYTKILVSDLKDRESLFSISEGLLNDGWFKSETAKIARKIAVFIKKTVPEYLMGEWRFANYLAALPIRDGLVDCFVNKGILTPPENGIGAEGCWMMVEK